LAEYALVAGEIDEEEEEAKEDVDIRLDERLLVVRRSSFSPSPADRLPLSRMTLLGEGAWLGPSGIAERGDPATPGLGGSKEEVDEVADEEREYTDERMLESVSTPSPLDNFDDR
jgi:hypothetical protein